MTTICINGGRVIDPAQQLDQITNLWIQDQKVVGIGEQPQLNADQILDATDMIVTPGLLDVHVHFREPGGEASETIETGTASALNGGVTTVACMPNTTPALDHPEVLKFIYDQSAKAGRTKVYPIGAISKNRDGKELVDMAQLVEAGAVAFTDDGTPVTDGDLMRAAMERAKDLDRPILSHSEDLTMSHGAIMNEGEVSRALGVPGYPAIAEEVMIFREIALAELTGAHIHILHVSSAVGVELIRRGKQRGVNVTGEACPHHFTLTDEGLRNGDTNFKMSPPLRTQKDIDAILEGLKDGTLDVLATDHAPHEPAKKQKPLPEAANGIVGLETFLPICVGALIEKGVLSWSEMIAKMTCNPAGVFRLERGRLTPGSIADVTIIDPNEEWTVEPEKLKSKSKNTPYGGWKVRGRAQAVFIDGEMKLCRDSFSSRVRVK